MSGLTNYDRQLLAAQQGFLTYDMEKIAREFGLACDERYLYVPFLGQMHRIDRETALPQCDVGGCWRASGFHAGMTLFDILTNPYGKPVPSGQWCAHSALNAVRGGTMKNELTLDSLPSESAKRFSGNIGRLRQICERLGAIPADKGDYACILPLFPWFSVLLRFWEADEEFPAQLQILWDIRTTRYLRYETTFYTCRAILDRISEL